MKQFKLGLFALMIMFFFLSPGLFASEHSSAHFNMILVGDPIIEDIRFLSLNTGRGILSFTFPLSHHEVRNFLDSIDESILSAPALEAFNRINRRLGLQAPFVNFSSDNFSVFLNINSTLEVKARTNQNISWNTWYPGGSKTIPPVISLPTMVFLGSFLQLYLEPVWRMSPVHYPFKGSFGFSAPLDYFQYDRLMPFRAFLAAGGPMWNFQIGRDRLSWGTGHMGNLTVSDNPHFYDFMRFSFFYRFFKYSVLVAQMPLDISHGLLCDTVFPSGVPPGHLYRTMNRYFYLHRLDFMLFNSLSIGISEGSMVGNSPLEIRFLNPMIVFHQLIAWTEYDRWGNRQNGKDGHMVGPIFSVDVNWNIINSLSVYGQFVLNQFEFDYEVESAGDHPSPDGMGFLAGIQYSHLFNNWASVFFFEFVHTSPFLNLHPSPFASFIHMRILLFDPPLYSFIGFPRDLMMFTLGARFFLEDTLSVSGVFSLLFNGQRDIYYDWLAAHSSREERTPSGIVERQIIGTVSARWKPRMQDLLVLRKSSLAFNGSLTGIHSANNGHVSGANETGLQAAFSVSVSF